VTAAGARLFPFGTFGLNRGPWRPSWSGGESDERKLIVRGAAHLLDDLKAVEDLERVRLLFDDLETKGVVVDLLGRAERADGARIFIGSAASRFRAPQPSWRPTATAPAASSASSG
jgi:hypothetical protein